MISIVRTLLLVLEFEVLSANVEEIFELLELLRMCFLLNSEPKKERKENSHGNVRGK